MAALQLASCHSLKSDQDSEAFENHVKEKLVNTYENDSEIYDNYDDENYDEAFGHYHNNFEEDIYEDDGFKDETSGEENQDDEVHDDGDLEESFQSYEDFKKYFDEKYADYAVGDYTDYEGYDENYSDIGDK